MGGKGEEGRSRFVGGDIHAYDNSFIYLHSSKNIIHNKMYMQDNKAAYATLTVALYNGAIQHYCTSRTHYNRQF